MPNAKLFDGHLDLAINALEFKRDLTLPLEALRESVPAEAVAKVGTPTVTFKELRRGPVRVVLSTLLARSKPWAAASPIGPTSIRDWPTQAMAYAVAMGQLAWYRLMHEQGHLRLITTRQALREHWNSDDPRLGVILTMEGADPILDFDQLQHWHDQGLRTLMLAHFGLSHYAHGTPSDDPSNTRDVDGPLTDKALLLFKRMGELDMPLDLTHLSDTSLAQAIDLFPGRIYSSHSGCRAICDRQRNHSDDVLRRIVERGGVIGLPMFNGFLDVGYTQENPDRSLVTLDRVVDHADHICQLAGNAEHVAIGSDLDGGFGREHAPADLDTIADLPQLADALTARGFSQADAERILGGNWLRFFGEALP